MKVIILTGPPGIGKTSVIQTLQKLSRSRFGRARTFEAYDAEDLGSNQVARQRGVLSYLTAQAKKQANGRRGAHTIVLGSADVTQSILDACNVLGVKRIAIVYLLLDQDAYEKRRTLRDTLNPSKKLQARHTISEWLRRAHETFRQRSSIWTYVIPNYSLAITTDIIVQLAACDSDFKFSNLITSIARIDGVSKPCDSIFLHHTLTARTMTMIGNELRPLLQLCVHGVIMRKGSVLLVDNPKRGWEIPGGHIICNESPVIALDREMSEETGSIWQILTLLPVNPREVKIAQCVYGVENSAFVDYFYVINVATDFPLKGEFRFETCGVKLVPLRDIRETLAAAVTDVHQGNQRHQTPSVRINLNLPQLRIFAEILDKLGFTKY